MTACLRDFIHIKGKEKAGSNSGQTQNQLQTQGPRPKTITGPVDLELNLNNTGGPKSDQCNANTHVVVPKKSIYLNHTGNPKYKATVFFNPYK